MSSISQVIDFQKVTATSETNFSFNKSNIQAPSTNGTANLVAIHKLITTPQYKAKFVQVQNMTRTLYEGYLSKNDAEKLKSQIDFHKKGLGYYLPSGTKAFGHGATDLQFNGCIGFDLDFRFGGGDKFAEGVKAALQKLDFIPFVHLSSGGYGLKGLFLTDLTECDSDLYSFAERQIFTFLTQLGLIFQYDRHALGKTCYFAFDEKAHINLDAKSFHIDLEAYNAQKAFQKRSISISKTDNNDAEVRQAVDFLIEHKINVANCYLEYLGFTGACIHAFGTEGGDIAYQILENSESFNLSSFKKTFDNHVKRLSSPSTGGQATERTILFHAREHGFKFQQPATSGQLDDYRFNNLDLFVVDRRKALERIKKETGCKIIVCESSYIETIKTELGADRFDGKKFDGAIGVCTYQDISKLLKVENLKYAKIYVLGCQNLGRKRYIFTANETEKLAKISDVVLFADTYIYTPMARSITIIDRHTPNANVIVSKNPQATFVELVKKQSTSEVVFLETHESVNKQLSDYQKVNRSEIYAADHKKTLFVLFDSKVGMMPESFSLFEKVVFVASSEQKPCVNMSTFCAANGKKTNDALTMIDNSLYAGDIEKIFYQAVKNQILAIRRNGIGWERCPNTEGVLETEHQINLLLSNADELKKYVERISVATHQTAKVTEATDTISEAIKMTKQDLAAEKKTEFFTFLEDVEKEGILSQSELAHYVAEQEEMSRGAKVAFNRLKTLSKVNTAFSTCFEAVKTSYSDWTKTKGRFFASKVIKGKTKIANSLQIFRDTTTGERYEKSELIEMARAILPMVNGNDNEVWKQLKRICFITSIRIRITDGRMRVYEVQFLE